MRMKLISVAIGALVSASAFAQSNVTVYGNMDIGLFSVDDENGNSVTAVESSGWTTSYLGFKGAEDLGNGLKAIFQIETVLNNDGNSTFGGARDTYVGLTGGFGTVIAGRNSTPLNNWLDAYDASGASNAFRSTNVNLTAFTGEANGLETRVDDSIVYAAPVFSGVQFAALYAPDENDATSNDIYGIGLRYDGGPISAMYTWHAVDNLVDSHVVGGAYDFGVARLMATYIFNDADASGLEDESAWSLGVSAPIGAGVVSLGYTAQSDVEGIDSNDIDVWALAYKHSLSKRTSAYAGYQRQDPDQGDSMDTFGVGIAHSF